MMKRLRGLRPLVQASSINWRVTRLFSAIVIALSPY